MNDEAIRMRHPDQSAWVVDSRCNSHMIYDRSAFVAYTSHNAVVNMVTSVTATVFGIGSVLLSITVNDSVRTVEM